MQMKYIVLAAALGAFSLGANANGLEEDRSWQFDSPNEKAVKLAKERTRLEKRGKIGPRVSQRSYTYVTGNDNVTVGTTIEGYNCINCATTNTNIGDNVTGDTNVNTDQGADGNSQTNSEATETNTTNNNPAP